MLNVQRNTILAWSLKLKKNYSLWTGFEPAREKPIGFQVQRLNHSAITAWYWVQLSIWKCHALQAFFRFSFFLYTYLILISDLEIVHYFKLHYFRWTFTFDFKMSWIICFAKIVWNITSIPHCKHFFILSFFFYTCC